MKIVINEEIATRAKIVMARNEDEDDDLFHDHHVPRKLLLAVMVRLGPISGKLIQ